LTWRARAAPGAEAASTRPAAAGHSTGAATAGTEPWASSSSSAAATTTSTSAFRSQNHLKQLVRVFEEILEFVALGS
jgi:hypothetical protein